MVDKNPDGLCRSNLPSIIMFAIVVVSILSIPLLLLFDAGYMMNDYDYLDKEVCKKIVINDTFSQIRGHYGSYTYYYIVTDDNKIYELAVAQNATKIYKWNTIVKGQEYNIKIYKEYAEFCEDMVLRFRK